MKRSGCLRLSSELELDRIRYDQRERAGAKKKIVVPEADILAATLELLQRHPKVAWARRSNVGSGFLLRSDVYRGLVSNGHLPWNTARFMQFGVKGAADVTGMLRGGRRFECEVKSDRGKPSDEQQIFGDAVNGGGGLWVLARSVDDVLRALQ